MTRRDEDGGQTGERAHVRSTAATRRLYRSRFAVQKNGGPKAAVRRLVAVQRTTNTTAVRGGRVKRPLADS